MSGGASGGAMRGQYALVADDHELFSWALQSLLKRDMGFDRVDLVGTYQDALDALTRNRSMRLLCLDLSMPGMNGFEGVRALKAASPPDMAIVIVTASTRRDDVIEAVKAGVHGYISKTMRTPEIASAIQKVLGGHVFIPPTITQTDPPKEAEHRMSGWSGTVAAKPPGDEVTVRRWSQLTHRQQAVGELIVRGKSNKEIAIILDLAEGTVKVHIAALFRALNVRNRAEAVSAIIGMRDSSA